MSDLSDFASERKVEIVDYSRRFKSVNYIFGSVRIETMCEAVVSYMRTALSVLIFKQQRFHDRPHQIEL